MLSEGEIPRFWVFLFLFLFGAIFYIYKDKIYLNQILALLCVLIFILSSYFNVLGYALLIAWPYLVIFIGVRYDGAMLSRYGDFSYGIYIFVSHTADSFTFFWEQHKLVGICCS